MWNNFDIQKFRGFNAHAEEYEKNRNANIKRTVEIREAASSGAPTVDLEFLNRQQMAMGLMANVIARMQEQQAANDQVIHNRMRNDVQRAGANTGRNFCGGTLTQTTLTDGG